MPAMARSIFVILSALFLIALVMAVGIAYRKTVSQREATQIREHSIKVLFDAITMSTNEPPSLETLNPLFAPNGHPIDASAYIFNTNQLFPGVRKEHRIVLAEKPSRFPRSGLLHAINEQGFIVSWRIVEYTNLLHKNGISADE
jgi:hypothetical protein